MNATLPWRLDDGIFFENAEALLPWNTEFASLRDFGQPTELERPTSVHISWPAAVIFGGLEGTVAACRILEEPNPRAYHIYLPTFHWASFALEHVHATVADAEHQMRRLHEHITNHLQVPATSYPDYQEGLPAIMWRIGPLRVGLGPSCRYQGNRRPELVGVGTEITVAHEPSDFAELREEAARIRAREGEGSEVDYVAWAAPESAARNS